MTRPRPPILLVHGAWHAADCWQSLLAPLRDHGHGVQALDLPGHGRRSGEAATMAAYTATVREALLRTGERTIVVGHSMGGLPVIGACEAAPEQVHAAVFVCAFLVPSGSSLRDYSAMAENADSALPAAMAPDPASRTITVRSERARQTFYNDCDDAVAAAAVAALRPQAMQPLGAPVAWTAERFGRVRRVYIRTLRDQTIRPALQDRMIADTGTREQLSIDASHSPFLSRPRALADLIAGLA